MKNFLTAHKRKVVQLLSAVIYNSNLRGFFGGKVYRGKLKSICVPGLNCYSCPGAVASCPLGAVQMAAGSVNLSFQFYIIGILLLFGVVFGRLICGFLCPFGLFQELLYKIPLGKIHRKFRFLKYLKYIILVVFVFFIPIFLLNSRGYAVPAFCKYICPAGTLEAGLPLVSSNDTLARLTGTLFLWKIGIAVFIIILSVFIHRIFCRFICPLGALYGLFNKISLCKLTLNKNKCTDCGKCSTVCKADILNVPEKLNSPECIRCGDCKKACPCGAINLTFGKT